MLPVLTAEQVRELEAEAVRRGAATLADLMDAAGAGLAEIVSARYPEASVAVLAGSGNNGGDGWTAARFLVQRGHQVIVLATREPHLLTAPACDAADAAVRSGVPWRTLIPETLWEDLLGVDVAVDALLGTGSRLPLSDEMRAICRAVRVAGVPVVSADLPTGCASDSGACDPDALAAAVTVSFSAPKLGCVTFPSAAHCGDVVVVEVGLPDDLIESVQAPRIIDREEYAALIPRLARDTHKNARGRVLVLAGSTSYPGAAILAAQSASRMGAGYVTLAVPEPVVPTAQAHLLSVIVRGLPSNAQGALSREAIEGVLELAQEVDAIVCGPGMTASVDVAALVSEMLERIFLPIVLDADALNVLDVASGVLARRSHATVLTPHPKELARLVGSTTDQVQAARLEHARALASGDTVVVLKGAGTVVAGEGEQFVITSGTPALATAGTGDVLAGMVGSLVAQGLEPILAAALGAYVHGVAGEAAALSLTENCVVASDVIDHIPVAVRMVVSGDAGPEQGGPDDEFDRA